MYRRLGNSIRAEHVCQSLQDLYGPDAKRPVFDSERSPLPRSSWYEPYYQLDAGIFIGRVNAVKLLLGLVYSFWHADKARDFMEVLHVLRLHHPHLIAVDTWAELFHSLEPCEHALNVTRTDIAALDKAFSPTLCGLDESTGAEVSHMQFSIGIGTGEAYGPRLLTTNTTPSVLHFAGASKYLLANACSNRIMELRVQQERSSIEAVAKASGSIIDLNAGELY